MTTNTPETDKEANNASLCDQCVPADFARQLETDRDQLRARVSELERERDEARNEFKLYAGWSKWKPGIWLIEHPETGPSATYIGERDAATEALKRARVAIEKAPHRSICHVAIATKLNGSPGEAKCTCWKAAALHDLAAAETDK